MTIRVFISSTITDLAEYRQVVREVIQAQGYEPVLIEELSVVENTPTADLSRRSLESADVFMGLYAQRYGLILPGTETSLTEDEFHRAISRGIFCRAFRLDPDFNWPLRFIDHDPAVKARLERFLGQVESAVPTETFTTPDSLAQAIRRALRDFEKRIQSRPADPITQVDAQVPLIGDRYLLQDLLGSGGMGTVHRALDRHSNRMVAVKAIRHDLGHTDKDWEHMVQRFRRESDALRLIRHRSVVELYDTVEENNNYYIVMELVEGGSLRELVSQQPLPVRRAVEIGIDVADGLEEAHRLNIVHRDIKPGNILIGNDGHTRITDFGLAYRPNESHITQSGAIVGTMAYLSPETIDSVDVDGRTDIWSFGVVLYEMLAGQQPFIGTADSSLLVQILLNEPPDIRALRPGLPGRLIRLLKRMLTKKRDERIQTAAEVSRELFAIRAELDDPSLAAHDEIPADETENIPRPQPTVEQQIDTVIVQRSALRTNRPSRTSTSLPRRSMEIVVGRDELLTQIREQIMQQKNVALWGLPGIGKTTLALMLAHDPAIQTAFPDGVEWIGLGRDPDTLARLGTWAENIGIAPATVADLKTIDERATLIHNTIGERRVLIVIDDAWGSADALNLKIGGPNCVHLLTSQRKEIALDFAGVNDLVLEVKELDPSNAFLLLENLVPKLVKERRKDALELIEAVGRLPLALTLVGKFLRKKLAEDNLRRLERALAQLRDPQFLLSGIEEIQSPLDRMPGTSSETPLSLLGVIGMTYAAMAGAEQAALGALSVFPPKPNSFSEEAAMSVVDGDIDIIDALVEFGIVECDASNRYSVHPLIVQFARHKQGDATAGRKLAQFFLTEFQPDVLSHAAFDVEKDNLAVALDAADGDLLARLMDRYYPYLERRGLYALAERHLQRAEALIRQSDDPAQLARLLLKLGQISMRRRNYPQAQTYLKEVLTLAQGRDRIESLNLLGLSGVYTGQLGETQAYLEEGLALARPSSTPEQIAWLLAHLGLRYIVVGEGAKARQFWEEALLFARQSGEKPVTSRVLGLLGALEMQEGRYDQAEPLLSDGISLAYATGHMESIIRFIHNLGTLELWRRNHYQAENYFLKGLALTRRANDQYEIAPLLANLSDSLVKRGRFAQAQPYVSEGITIARAIDDQYLLSMLLESQGSIALGLDNLDEAEAAFRESLRLAEADDMQDQERRKGEAQWGLSRVAGKRGDRAAACALAISALANLEPVNYPYMDDLRARVTDLDCG